MKDDDRHRRHQAISVAAYDLLAKHGYGGTSMLRVARAARASNETLYRWYGDKDGLFLAMVQDNAAALRHLLETELEGQGDPLALLDRVAPVFLRMILGDRAVLLNRAAAADPTGRLGAAIAAGGRDQILPLLHRLIGRICPGREVEAGEWLLGLLVGDLQIRRILNTLPPLTDAEIERRCRRALAAFRTLTG